MKKAGLYASVGSQLTHYDVDVDGYALTRLESIKLPANVQYVWPHASRPIMYVASSSKISRDMIGTDHYLNALSIDSNGRTTLHGPTVQLTNRPLHLTTDRDSRNLLVAFNAPAELQIYRINADGTIGERVAQRDGIDTGKFPHQIRITGDDQLAILVTRGNPFRGHDAHAEKQTDAGALKVFDYRGGTLGAETSVAPGDGWHFGPRHIDYFPNSPWIFVSLETQNKLLVLKREGNKILPEPLFERDLLQNPKDVPTHQGAGTLHVHPNGRILYCVNRGHVPTDYQGRKVLIGVDNTFAVFSINQATGEPTLIQHLDAGGICPRTFSVHPSGKLLVAANCEAHLVKKGNDVVSVPANLSLFEIKSDGTLRYVRTYDIETGPQDKLFWAGIVEYQD